MRRKSKKTSKTPKTENKSQPENMDYDFFNKIFKDSFLNEDLVNFGYKLSSIKKIVSKSLEKRFKQAKGELAEKPNRQSSLKEGYAFYRVKPNEDLAEIASRGLVCSPSQEEEDNLLGCSSKGITLINHGDILVSNEYLKKTKEFPVILVKYVIREFSLVTPDPKNQNTFPNFDTDCHLCKDKPLKSDPIDFAFKNSLIYLYEYDKNGELCSQPRNILPMAVLNFKLNSDFKPCFLFLSTNKHLLDKSNIPSSLVKDENNNELPHTDESVQSILQFEYFCETKIPIKLLNNEKTFNDEEDSRKNSKSKIDIHTEDNENIEKIKLNLKQSLEEYIQENNQIESEQPAKGPLESSRKKRKQIFEDSSSKKRILNDLSIIILDPSPIKLNAEKDLIDLTKPIDDGEVKENKVPKINFSIDHILSKNDPPKENQFTMPTQLYYNPTWSSQTVLNYFLPFQPNIFGMSLQSNFLAPPRPEPLRPRSPGRIRPNLPLNSNSFISNQLTLPLSRDKFF